MNSLHRVTCFSVYSWINCMANFVTKSLERDVQHHLHQVTTKAHGISVRKLRRWTDKYLILLQAWCPVAMHAAARGITAARSTLQQP